MKESDLIDISSPRFIPHQFLIGSPLLLITLFCFGFVMVRQHTAAQLGPPVSPKSAPSSLQSSGGLFITKPELPVLSPVGTPGSRPNDPEDTVTPQLPGVATSHIQSADQKRQAAADNGGSLESLLDSTDSNAKGTGR